MIFDKTEGPAQFELAFCFCKQIRPQGNFPAGVFYFMGSGEGYFSEVLLSACSWTGTGVGVCVGSAVGIAAGDEVGKSVAEGVAVGAVLPGRRVPPEAGPEGG